MPKRDQENQLKSRYSPRQKFEPVRGWESEDWPEMDDPDRVRQTLSRKAFQAGYDGDDADGEPVRLARIVDHAIDGWVAGERLAATDKATELQRIVESGPEGAEKAVRHADDHDRETAKHVAEAEQARRQREVVRHLQAELGSNQRGGRLEGKEGILAATCTGVLDGAVFALMISSLGGSLGIRIGIALGLTLAFTVIVAAAGRLVGEIWQRMASMPGRASGIGVVLALASLLSLVGGAIVSAGEFRAEAVISLTQGFPAEPHFLVWVQGALTLAATCAIGAWHVSGEGDHLREEERSLTVRITNAEALARASQEEACKARDRALEIMAESKAAQQELSLLETRLDQQLERLRATGMTIVEVVFASFEEGRTAREKADAARARPFRTVDDELADAVRIFAANSRRGTAKNN